MKQHNGYKYCPHCECVYPIIFFNYDKSQSDNLDCYCRYCTNEFKYVNKEITVAITCIKCNKISPITRLGALYCKECRKKYQKEYRKEYRKTPQGKYVDLKSRLKRRGIIHKFTIEEWQQKLKDSNGICLMCGENKGIENLSLDHIIPINKVKYGTVYTINDIQPLCLSCNSHKRDYCVIVEDNNGGLDISYDRLKKRLTPEVEDYLFHNFRELYSKIVDFLDTGVFKFNEDELLILSSL